MNEQGAIWVFAEQQGGRVQPVALELVGEARRLAGKAGMEVAALLLGDGVAGECDELFAHGAQVVYLCEDPTLAVYRSEPYSAVIARLARERRPDILLLGATAIGHDLAPTVAAVLQTGLSADCTALEIDDGGLLLQTVPAFGDAMMATIICPARRPQMATVRPGVFTPRRVQLAKGDVVRVPAELSEDQIRVKVVDVSTAEREPAALEDADIVVAGGAGIGSAEGWQLLRELARRLGGAVGATRPAVDDGYASEAEMIGQSGKTVHPRLYLGVGISGEMQHMVGLRDAGTIVAINRDPQAKIFQGADYGIVADYRDVLPSLMRMLGDG